MHGMQITDPWNVWEVNSDIDGELENVFRTAEANKVEFLLIGHPDNEKTLHRMLLILSSCFFYNGYLFSFHQIL